MVILILTKIYSTMNDKIGNMKLPVVLGKNDKGEIITKDLVDYCHILIGGISGQGKTTCINTIVTSLLKGNAL